MTTAIIRFLTSSVNSKRQWEHKPALRLRVESYGRPEDMRDLMNRVSETTAVTEAMASVSHDFELDSVVAAYVGGITADFEPMDVSVLPAVGRPEDDDADYQYTLSATYDLEKAADYGRYGITPVVVSVEWSVLNQTLLQNRMTGGSEEGEPVVGEFSPTSVAA